MREPDRALEPGVERLLDRLVRRFRLSQALHVALRLFPVLLLGLLARELLVRHASLPAGPFVAAAVGGLSVLLGSSAIGAFLGAAGRQEVALLLDRRLGTRELLSAAVEAGPGASHPLQREARRRAAELLESTEARRAFPLARRAALGRALWPLPLLLLAPLVPAASVRRAEAGKTPSRTVTETGRHLAREADAVQARLDRQGRRDLARLKELARRMERGEVGSRVEALAALERFERSAGQGRRPEDAGDALPLRAALASLARDPLGADLARGMRETSGEELRKALERTATILEKPPWADRARDLGRLAEKLDSVASELERLGEAEAAGALRELARALGRGDVRTARELLASAGLAGSCRQAGVRCEGAGRASRELAELLNAARYLLGEGNPPRLQTRTVRLDDGPSAQRSAGPHAGVGSTNEKGPGYRTGSPFLRDRQSSETSEKTGTWEARYASEMVKGERWEDVQARGTLGNEGELVSQPSLALGVAGKATVFPGSGGAVPGAPERAGELERVPLGYRDLVRRYFSEPAGKR